MNAPPHFPKNSSPGFSDGVKENNVLGVGLRFWEIFSEGRQHLRDIVSVHLARIIHELSGLRTMG